MLDKSEIFEHDVSKSGRENPEMISYNATETFID